MKRMVVLLVVVAVASPCGGAVVGPVATPPAGGAEAWSGHPGFGSAGLTILGTGYDVSQVGSLYWGIDASAFGFGMDGGLHSMALQSVSGNVAQFTGSSPVHLANTTAVPVLTLQTTMSLTSIDGLLKYDWTLSPSVPGLTGSTGVVHDVVGDFKVTMHTLAYWPGGHNQTVSAGWYPYGDLYELLETPPEVNDLVVNVGSAYWYEPVPEATALVVWTLLGACGLGAFWAKKRRAG